MKRNLLYAVVLSTLMGSFPAVAADESDLMEAGMPGPVPARVLRVIDGDTIRVRAHIWLGQEVETNVRLRGVDAAEMHARCNNERQLAERARAFVEDKLADDRIALTDIGYDKYGKRVVANVLTADGQDVSKSLLTAGLAHPYWGGHKQSWCAGQDTAEP